MITPSEDIHFNIKSRLKDAAKAVQDLTPLYKLIIEFNKSLECTKRIGEQVAQKFVEIGLSKINSEWGQAYVTVGEVHHNLNKSMDLWLSSVRELCSSHLHKTAERDKEDIHACVKAARSSLSTLEMIEAPAGDRRSVSNLSRQIDLKTSIEKKKGEILADIDAFENSKCLSLAQHWVEVLAHQPFTPNTNVLDKLYKLKRIPSRTHIAVPSSLISVGLDQPTAARLEGIISPRTFERSYSFATISPAGSPKSPPVVRTLSHTISQSSLPVNFPFLSSPLPAGSSIHLPSQAALSVSPSQPLRNGKPANTSGLKNFFGKITKTISPSSSSSSSSSSSNRASATVAAPTTTSPLDSPRDDAVMAQATIATPVASTFPVGSAPPSPTPDPSARLSMTSVAHSTGTTGKSKYSTFKKRRHTVVTAAEALAAKDTNVPAPDVNILYPPKRNFCYKQEVCA
jgi:thiamine phosphate synthase YjbQ (UPF0047 family)